MSLMMYVAPDQYCVLRTQYAVRTPPDQQRRGVRGDPCTWCLYLGHRSMRSRYKRESVPWHRLRVDAGLSLTIRKQIPTKVLVTTTTNTCREQPIGAGRSNRARRVPAAW